MYGDWTSGTNRENAVALGRKDNTAELGRPNRVVAAAAIPGSVLWPLLPGSAVTLVSTVAVQWASLTYQTKRRREARRADFQRTTLLQVRDALDDLG